MKYVKIVAENYNEAIKKLRIDHGDDAIPISHKYIKEGGLFKSKLFAKEVVELTAAVKDKRPFPGASLSSQKKSTFDFIVDDKNEPVKSSKVQEIIDRASSSASLKVDSINKSIDSLNDSLNSLKKPASSFNSDPVEKVIPQAALNIPSKEKIVTDDSNDELVKHIEKEVHEIKAALNKLIENQSKEKNIIEEDSQLAPVREILLNNDFDPQECEYIIREVRNSISREELKDKYKIEKSLKELLKGRIVTTGPIQKGSRKKIIMFIGPTGVGKTTTMAKLGAIHSLREGNKVAFITIDNYRIAATEQLKKYAEIMRIPIHVVSEQKQFKDVIAKEKADIIMVDTSGRSHKNELKIAEIKSFAETIDFDFEKILCVSANTKKTDLEQIFKSFNVMDFDSVIITKVDETSYIGNVINVADKYNKPISYFTNGQEVPNDIRVADAEEIADMIVREPVNQ
ncbi:MAG TPA: flagellar biosynthesis protein FlhF [Spirochaetota bacterium]|jgi:flagellar biosynthesis protein FlhF|nr:flagellar biosynthesis protein FlhF [Spirochaetota bacterium]OQA98919.1 MAG: Flagellar biosynthesis protein FlhF [Spirochaetes bacterium ADurb.Bin218]HOK03058.1 flagellar biosynthesis protein FlhF [Spirochaetota bacterium]HOK92430.1 flagellar biosynthesis protein FlhF [Spirochaetota bacterium]HOV08581.1 flagellar biosynthesis protein FlhF [Spirochaetota bacterium]